MATDWQLCNGQLLRHSKRGVSSKSKVCNKFFSKATMTWFYTKFGIVVIATKIKDSDGNREAAIVAAV